MAKAQVRVLGIKPSEGKEGWYTVGYKYTGGSKQMYVARTPAVDELAAYMWFVRSMNNVHYEVVTDE